MLTQLPVHRIIDKVTSLCIYKAENHGVQGYLGPVVGERVCEDLSCGVERAAGDRLVQLL